MMDSSKIIGHLASAAAYAIFGLNIVFCKDIANNGVISPIGLFTLRALGASILFWGVSFFMPREKVPIKDLGAIVLASIIGLYIPQLTFLKAITVVTSIDTAILSTLTPIFTMFFAAIFIKEPITMKKAGGVVLSACGVLLLIFNSVHSGSVTESSPFGIGLILVNGLSFAAYLGIFKPLISRYSVITFMKWMFLASLILSLPISARELVTVNYAAIKPDVLFEIGYLILFATFFAYFLIPVGQKRLRPTLVCMYTYLQPIIAAIVSICTGLDVMTWQKGVAIVLVFVGVWIVNRSRAAQS